MLTDDERKALVFNKVRRARETWEETKGIIKSGYWYAAANRMYYACYYMTSALLLKIMQSAHTHVGTIGLFGLHFVKTGIVSGYLENSTANFLNLGKLAIMTIGRWSRKVMSGLWFRWQKCSSTLWRTLSERTGICDKSFVNIIV